MPWPLRTPYRTDRMLEKMNTWSVRSDSAYKKIYDKSQTVFALMQMTLESEDQADSVISAIEELERIINSNLYDIQKLHNKTNKSHRKGYRKDGAGHKKYKILHNQQTATLNDIQMLKLQLEAQKLLTSKSKPILRFNKDFGDFNRHYENLLKDSAHAQDHFKALGHAFDLIKGNFEALKLDQVKETLKTTQFLHNLAQFRINSVEDNQLELTRLKETPSDGAFFHKTYILAEKLLTHHKANEALFHIKTWLEMSLADDRAKNMLDMGHLVYAIFCHENCSTFIDFKTPFLKWSAEKKLEISSSAASKDTIALEKQISLLEGKFCAASAQFDSRSLEIYKRCVELEPDSKFWKRQCFIGMHTVATSSENQASLEALFKTIHEKGVLDEQDGFWQDLLSITCHKLSDSDPLGASEYLGKWWKLAQDQNLGMRDFEKIASIILDMPSDIIKDHAKKLTEKFESFLQDHKHEPSEIKAGLSALDATNQEYYSLLKDIHNHLSSLYLEDKTFHALALEHFKAAEAICPSPQSRMGIFNCLIESGQKEQAHQYMQSLNDVNLLPQAALASLEAGQIAEAIAYAKQLTIEIQAPLIQQASLKQYNRACGYLNLASKINIWAIKRFQNNLDEEIRPNLATSLKVAGGVTQLLTVPAVQRQLFSNSWIVESPALLKQQFQKSGLNYIDLESSLLLLNIATSYIIPHITKKNLPFEIPTTKEQKSLSIKAYGWGSLTTQSAALLPTAEKIFRNWSDFKKDRVFQSVEVLGGLRTGLGIFSSIYEIRHGKTFHSSLNPVLRSLYDLSQLSEWYSTAVSISEMSFTSLIEPNLSSRLLAPANQFFKYTVMPSLKNSLPKAAAFISSPYAVKIAAEVSYLSFNILVNFRLRKMEHIMLDAVILDGEQGHDKALAFLDSYINHRFVFHFISFDYDLMKKFRWVLQGIHRIHNQNKLFDLQRSWIDDTNIILTKIAPHQHMAGLVAHLNIAKLVYYLKTSQFQEAKDLVNYPGVFSDSVKKTLYQVALHHSQAIAYGKVFESDALQKEPATHSAEYLDEIVKVFPSIEHKSLLEAYSAFLKLDKRIEEACNDRSLLAEVMPSINAVISAAVPNEEFSYIYLGIIKQKFYLYYIHRQFEDAKALLQEFASKPLIYDQLLVSWLPSHIHHIMQMSAQEAKSLYNKDLEDLALSEDPVCKALNEQVFTPVVELNRTARLYFSRLEYKFSERLNHFKELDLIKTKKALVEAADKTLAMLKKSRPLDFIQELDKYCDLKRSLNPITFFDEIAPELKLHEEASCIAYRDLIGKLTELDPETVQNQTSEQLAQNITLIERFFEQNWVDLDKSNLPFLISLNINLELLLASRATTSIDLPVSLSHLDKALALTQKGSDQERVILRTKTLLTTLSAIGPAFKQNKLPKFIKFLSEASSFGLEKDTGQTAEIKMALRYICQGLAEDIGDYFYTLGERSQARHYFTMAFDLTPQASCGQHRSLRTKINMC